MIFTGASILHNVPGFQMLQFFFAPDTCSLATLITLLDAGAEFETHRIDFSSEMQKSAEFLAINPKARVPVLLTDKGSLTETPAMLAYLAHKYPTSALAPLEDVFEFAKIHSFNSYICSSLHVAHAHRMRGYRWSDDLDAIASMQRKVPESVSECYRYIEENEFVGPYVMGENYTIADPYLFTVAQWMESDGVEINQFPKIVAHREMMAKRKNVKAALQIELN